MELNTRPQPGRPGAALVPNFLHRHGDKLVALVPLFILIWIVARHSVDVPFHDQWQLVPLLEKMYQGNLTFHDLWAQHHEHRLIFPRLIMLLLARLTHWNIRCEMGVNILLALGIFTAFVHQVKITERRLAIGRLPWAVPAISLVVFSLSQFENWLWGWQLQMFLNLLAVLGGVVLLANNNFSWRRFIVGALLGIVATYSFASGLLFWIIGLVILFVVTTGKKERRPAVLAWLAISALVFWSYVYHYQKPAEHPALNFIYQSPLAYAAYLLKYFGGICAQYVGGGESSDSAIAFVFGLAGMAAFSWAGVALVHRKIADARTLLPYFAMSLYSIGSALITGVGRLGFGSNQALASRYCTMVTPFWITLVVWLILLRHDRSSSVNTGSVPGPRKMPIPDAGQTVATWILLAVMVMLTLGTVFGADGVRDEYRMQAHGRNSLLDLAANPQGEIDYYGLYAICAPPQIIVERYPILVKYRLSLFRDAKPSPFLNPTR
jgi:hypothetical protein